MIPGAGETSAEGSAKLQFLQPNRDLQSNWEVDLARNLEEYLLRICSGEIGDDELCSVNFAEAALLLQGSAQVYSRKVEYLYSLVLQALEFVTHKRQEQTEKASCQPDGSEPSSVLGDEGEAFLGLDDVPVEAKICLDAEHDRSENVNKFVKPPANLLVLEGDCLDTSGDGSELESYLLATCNFYEDFLLLDPCDAGAVSDFLRSAADLEDNVVHRGSSVRSKSRRASMLSPFVRSGGASQKSRLGKKGDACLEQGLQSPCNIDNHQPSFHVHHDFGDPDAYNVEDPDIGYSDPNVDSDDSDEDPWKPLNPHEPGNLKIRPFRKVKGSGRQILHQPKRKTVDPEFPIARVDHIISSEFAESFEVQNLMQKKIHDSKSPPLFEKLRKILTGEQQTSHGLCDDDGDDREKLADDVPDYSQEEFDLFEPMHDIDAEVPPHDAKQSDEVILEGDDLTANEDLEDLCRSHLDALLASIAETEKQTELAARVSTWKQRVEHSLEEQDAHPPFDIKQYGDEVIDKLSKLSLDASSGRRVAFTDVVRGQAKHDISRTFSALLQLVNNGTVNIERASVGSELVCHTAVNPFYVRLIGQGRTTQETVKTSAKKRMLKSPFSKGPKKRNDNNSEAISPEESSLQNGRVAIKLGKGGIVRCTPDGKRRRKSSQLTDEFDLQSAG